MVRIPVWSIPRPLVLMMALAAFALGATMAGGRALADQPLRIATEGDDYRPFYSTENGRRSGFEIDLAQALCRAMAAQCELVAVDWNTIIDNLLANQYDAIMSSMAITEARKERVAFSDKYYSTGSRFVVRRDSGITGSAEALRGRRLGAQAETIHAATITQQFGNASLFGTSDLAFQALVDGTIDGLLGENIALWNLLQTERGACCTFVGEFVGDKREVGVALRKEDTALLDRFNRAIARVLADGTYEEINARYLPFSIY